MSNLCRTHMSNQKHANHVTGLITVGIQVIYVQKMLLKEFCVYVVVPHISVELTNNAH